MGDANGDGIVGGPDFVTVIANFGDRNGPSGIPADNPLHGATCYALPFP